MGGFGTPSVAIATTPTVVSAFFGHLFARRKRKSAAKKSLAEGGPGGGPEDQLSYEEGLKVVRRFIDFSSHHGVEEVQAFTAMAIPAPHWVRRKVVPMPLNTIDRAAEILTKHLASYGPHGANGGGIQLIGGQKWWRVRGRELEGEWVEMQKDYLRRKATLARTTTVSTLGSAPEAPPAASSVRWSYLPHRGDTMGSVRDSSGRDVSGDRVILYIHGGAFFFSSLDTHRYQVQRHARKAGARAFSPAYRLAPQYPFPCGLLDSLAAYLYLIDPPPGVHDPISPTSIIFMGDSAGAGMCISLLVLIREMGLPMPAGASLISPWVDLTHSMPSIGGWDGGDFIPSAGFHYRPSASWPPLPGDGISVEMPNGEQRHFDEQVQMYCANNLLTHPLISLVNQGSLGGLCPLLIIGGGGELLRDEIIYLAHKAAHPLIYQPSHKTLEQYPDQAALIGKYPPTKVHLQIYEGCCHVVPTLSWTRSSKYMYRACANFNIWAFTAAQKALEHKLKPRRSKEHLRDHSRRSTQATSHNVTPSSTVDASTRPSAPLASVAAATRVAPLSVMTDSPVLAAADSGPPSSIPSGSAPASRNPSVLDLTKPIINSTAADAANDEDMDEIDVESEASSDSDDDSSLAADKAVPSEGVVTVNGIEPIFGGTTMVSERVSTHGRIRPFEPIAEVPALDPALRDHIGQVHGAGAIQKWLAKRAEWDEKYSSQLAKWREIRRVDREKAEAEGFLTRDLQGERPPLASLAGWYDQDIAREVGKSVDEISKKTSGAVMMWMNLSSKADKEHAGGDNLAEIKENVKQELAEEREIGGRRKSVSTRRPSNAAALARQAQLQASAP